jgi:hypothetical protein
MKRFLRLLPRLALTLVGLLAVLALAVVGWGWMTHAPRPEGTPGEAAEALARRMEAAVDVEAWRRTGAVRWVFAGRHRHLWDRRRGLARIRFDDVEVLLYAGAPRGRVFRWVDGRRGEAIRSEEVQELLQRGHEAWINDSFWLNPVAKLRDDGVTLSTVEVDGDLEGLLVSYASGGVTPGDAYLWHVAADGTPVAWRMWVSIIPIGGLEVSWEGWQTLSTGARVATTHGGIPGVTLVLSEIEGAATLEELLGGAEDPFLPLEE